MPSGLPGSKSIRDETPLSPGVAILHKVAPALCSHERSAAEIHQVCPCSHYRGFGQTAPHRSGEWPKNTTVRILLSVRILIEFEPQCPGSIHYSVFGKKAYLADWAAGTRGGCSMSSWDEEMFTMMGGFAAFAILCIATLLWLV